MESAESPRDEMYESGLVRIRQRPEPGFLPEKVMSRHKQNELCPTSTPALSGTAIAAAPRKQSSERHTEGAAKLCGVLGALNPGRGGTRVLIPAHKNRVGI